MAAPVGALNVMLGVNTAQFTQGLNQAQTSLTRFASNLKGVMAGVTAALAPAALAAAFKKTIDHADEMGKAAQKIGVPIEELSKLRYAAEQSGVSFESLSTSMGRLSRAMAESVGKEGGQAKQAFDALGISVKSADGTMKSSSQVLSEVAGKMANFKDGANKTAIAMAIFGRAGADLIPMLNAGATGIEGLKQRAEELGIVIDDKTYKAAEKFNDALNDLYKMIGGAFITVLARVAPMMEQLADAMGDAATKGNGFTAVADAVEAALKRVAMFAATTVMEFQKLAAAFNLAMAIGNTTVGPGMFGEISEHMATFRKSTSEAQEAYDSFAFALNARPLTIGGGKGAPKTEAPNPFEQAGKAAKAGAAKMTEAERETARLYQKLKSDAQSLYESTRTPLEAYTDQMEKLRQMMSPTTVSGQSNALISQETYTRALTKAQDDYTKALIASSEVGQSFLSNMNSAFDSFLQGTFKARDAIKKLINDLIKMAMNKVFMQLIAAALPGGGGAGIGGFFSGLFGGARAAGGPVSGGRAYLVGEKGPELLVPNSAGTIIPNSALDGGQAMSISVSVQGANGDQHVIDLVKQGVSQGLRTYDRMLPGRLADMNMRG